MNVLSWVFFGLIVGIVANVIDPTPKRGGLVGSMFLGIVGALVGGFIANLFFRISLSAFDLTSFLVATAGALLLLFFGKAVRHA